MYMSCVINTCMYDFMSHINTECMYDFMSHFINTECTYDMISCLVMSLIQNVLVLYDFMYIVDVM